MTTRQWIVAAIVPLELGALVFMFVSLAGEPGVGLENWLVHGLLALVCAGVTGWAAVRVFGTPSPDLIASRPVTLMIVAGMLCAVAGVILAAVVGVHHA
jgi:hypothetical protein